MTTAPSGALLRTESDGTVTLTLCRPGHGNALDPELVESLSTAVAAAGEQQDIHTLVLRGAGPNFCTGFDLAEFENLSDGDLLLRFVRIEAMLDLLYRSPLRTMAIASGHAWGAGADLFCACDRRVARADASFRFPGVRFGLVLGTQRLSKRIGSDAARRAVIEGVTFGADAAHDAGLATDVVEGDADPWLTDLATPVADRATAAAIKLVTCEDHRDTDLAALVRSAARPGLRQRIGAYRASLVRQ